MGQHEAELTMIPMLAYVCCDALQAIKPLPFRAGLPKYPPCWALQLQGPQFFFTDAEQAQASTVLFELYNVTQDCLALVGQGYEVNCVSKLRHRSKEPNSNNNGREALPAFLKWGRWAFWVPPEIGWKGPVGDPKQSEARV